MRNWIMLAFIIGSTIALAEPTKTLECSSQNKKAVDYLMLPKAQGETLPVAQQLTDNINEGIAQLACGCPRAPAGTKVAKIGRSRCAVSF